MGQGGGLRIINASLYTLKRAYIHSYQMNSWDDSLPETIDCGKICDCYIEWNENIFHNNFDDGAEAGYNIVGTDPLRHFEIQARTHPELRNWRHLQVDWQNTIQDPEFFPQPFPQVVDLGWAHDGTVTLTFCAIKKGIQVEITHTPAPRYLREAEFPVAEEQLRAYLSKYAGDDSEILPFSELLARVEAAGYLKSQVDLQNFMNKALGEQDVILQRSHPFKEYVAIKGPAYLKNWMETYGPVIEHLSFNKLTLVCTHDSGTYDMVSPVAQPWASCQDLNLVDQLNEGVRVLDLRVGCQSDKSGDEKFILVHNTWRTNVTLSDALKQVKDFLSRNTREVVILDFHDFVDLEGPFDYDGLSNLVIDTLGGLLYSYPNKIPTLEGIWKTPARIIVAWNRNDRLTKFSPGVNQIWFNKNNLDDLHSSIAQEIIKDHSNEGLWSICAILTPTNAVPIHALSPDVDNWFTAGSDWAQRANIIALDMVEKTNVVQQAISECLVKGSSQKVRV